MNKLKYEEIDITIIEFNNLDIITTSVNAVADGDVCGRDVD